MPVLHTCPSFYYRALGIYDQRTIGCDAITNIHDVLHYQPGDNAWVYDVFWQDGYTSDVTERSEWNPMGEEYNCTRLLERDYKQCESEFTSRYV